MTCRTFRLCLAAVLFIAALCIAQQLKAQEPCPLVPPPACVKVLVKDKGGEGSRSGGTGALIGPRLVVTCNHVVKDRQSDKVEIMFPNWRLVQARVIAVDKKIDLCLIEMDEDHGTPFSLSVRAQWSTGDQFTVMGYGYGPFKAAQGPLNGSGWGDYWKMVEDATARSGDSGGPVIDSEGRYAGTLWGSASNDGTYFTPVDLVVKFVLKYSKELATPPNPYIFSKGK